MGNKKRADEDSAHLQLFRMKVMHDKQCLLSCINLGGPGGMASTARLIILMGEKVQLTLLAATFSCWKFIVNHHKEKMFLLGRDGAQTSSTGNVQ